MAAQPGSSKKGHSSSQEPRSVPAPILWPLSFLPWAPALAILGCASSEAHSHISSNPPFFLMNMKRGVPGLFMAHDIIQSFLPNTLRTCCLLVMGMQPQESLRE